MSIFNQANSTAMRRVLAIKFAIVLNCLYPSAGFSADADAALGQRRAGTCNACHGQSTMKSVPNLGGQNSAYFIAAMVAYKDSTRAHATMRDVARAWSTQDFRNFAAWYAEPVSPTAEPSAAPASGERCASCHGSEGREPITPDIPRIAGQKPGYIAQVLSEYRAGTRVHTVMQQQAAELSDADIAALAQYFSARAGLTVK